jgi:hypothetical protein
MRTTVIILMLLLFGQKSLIAQYNGFWGKETELKKYLHSPTIEKKLFLINKSNSEKKRIKEGATIIIELKNGDSVNISFVKLINSEGLFLTPIKYLTDSSSVDTTQYYENYLAGLMLEPIVFKNYTDSIVFVKYNEIEKIAFHNNLKNRYGIAVSFVILGIAYNLPLLLSAFNPVMLPLGLVMSGIGTPMFGISYYNLKKLQKFEIHSMSEWNFKIKEKLK